ncbi:hypothetical protein ACHAW6_012707 [Cyclotella cf. meneghiniana]
MMIMSIARDSFKTVVSIIIASITCELALSFQWAPTAAHGIEQHKQAALRAISPMNEIDDALSRRQLFSQAISSLVSCTVILGDPYIADAKVVSSPSKNNVPSDINSPQRDALIQVLSNKSSDPVVLQAIENLIPLNPMKAKGAANYANALNGEWKLLWYNKSDFSPLIELPSPFRPDSYQYFGDVAAKEVGAGRVAQGLTGGVLSALGPNKELWLSSGAVAKEDDSSILEIYPPFRLQLGQTPGSSVAKQTIIESQSDAEFRAVNARSTEAQLAPKNEYEQLYLENFGRGSLRISVVARGDPVIVGEMFVHQKL